MSHLWNHDDERRYQLFNGRQIDPTRAPKRAGTSYFARRSITREGKRHLMPDDFMPAGPHASKHLRAVPPDYLLWVDRQPWSKDWVQWGPVADFIRNYVLSDPETAETIAVVTQPVIFVDPLAQYPTSLRCFKDGSSHLHTLPGHLDLLQTFAQGALGLDPGWFQNKELPHFDLTVRKHRLALDCGAVEIDRRQLIAHRDIWRQFRDSQPRHTDDLPTPRRLPHQRIR